jgi:RNA polymerase sigma-70 factor (ECF subfamily)
MITDEDLMQDYSQGRQSAFDTLYQRHADSTYRYFVKQVHTHAIAEELYQELWLRVIKNRAGYKVQAAFTTWLYRIGRNLIIDYYRKHQKVSFQSIHSDSSDQDDRPSLEDTLYSDQTQSFEQQIFNQQQISQYLRLLEKLPPLQKEAYLLKEEGFSVEAIASITETTQDTVRSRIRYALTKIRKGMTHYVQNKSA